MAIGYEFGLDVAGCLWMVSGQLRVVNWIDCVSSLLNR